MPEMRNRSASLLPPLKSGLYYRTRQKGGGARIDGRAAVNQAPTPLATASSSGVPMAGSRTSKKKPVQRSLEQTGQFPLLKKPSDVVGKHIGVPGEHWGSACPPADKNKIFQCIITDYTVLHQHSPLERWPAMKLSEMGTDGQGGNSEAFWMRYSTLSPS